MLAKDLRQKTADELKTLAAELEAQVRSARFGLATRQFTKVSELKGMRRTLARVKTVLRELSR